MSFLAGGLTVMLVALVVRGVLAVLHRPRQAKTQTVVWSKLMLVIGILGCTLWLALALWALFDGQSPWVPILCLGMSFLLGGDMTVSYTHLDVYKRQQKDSPMKTDRNSLLTGSQEKLWRIPTNPL